MVEVAASVGKRLHGKRAELTERSFAHIYETGRMRRLHLRGSQNILKRLLIHGAGLNLALLMRKRHGKAKPRRPKAPVPALSSQICVPVTHFNAMLSSIRAVWRRLRRHRRGSVPYTEPLAIG